MFNKLTVALYGLLDEMRKYVQVMLGAIPLVMTEDYIKKASRRTSQAQQPTA
jgi:hypothetical protein